MSWIDEWNKFSDDAIKDMKKYSDKTHEEREWMCYVYEADGEYHLGNVTYGDESRIEVNPTAKHNEDALVNGLTNKKWTIHGHPLKDGKIYTGRQYFSSTDVLDEFIKCRDTNEYIVQYVVYPHQQLDTNTGEKVIHNRVRTLVFPNRQVLQDAMSRSNPGVDIMTITQESGQNSNASDGSLKNAAGVDWFAFQESLGDMGYMGVMDLEGPAAGAKSFRSERMWVSNFGLVGLVAAGLVALVYYNSNSKSFGAEVEVVEGVGDWHEN